MSFFDSISQLPDDPILGIVPAFASDPRPNKVNLGVGTYKDAEARTGVLQAVKMAEEALLHLPLSKEYIPIEGSAPFVEAMQNLVFGDGFAKRADGRAFTMQAIGGTGALRVGAEFLMEETSKTVFIPNQSWSNHKMVFGRSGMKIHYYRYYDPTAHRLDFAGMCSDIEQMPPGSVLLLHAVCHNPTGIDPTSEQWEELSFLIKKRNVIPFFDLAYQGFKGSVDEDASSVRYFFEQGHEMLVAQSLSKNFGLYGERVGSLTLVAEHKDAARRAASHFRQIIRSMYSSPPRHGAEIVLEILRTERLRNLWLSELQEMCERLKSMREQFVDALMSYGGAKDWDFLKRQVGLFSYLGLNEAQVHRLLERHAIYMLAGGRVNVAGLNERNIEYVVKAIVDVAFL